MISNYRNNEIITSILIKQMLMKNNDLSISEVLLIAPFLYSVGFRKTIDDGRINSRSLEELIQKEKKEALYFNDRYKEYLLNSFNSIMLLEQLKLIKIENGVISNENNSLLNPTSYKKIKEYEKSIEFLSNIFRKVEVSNIYYLLKIEL